MLRALWPRPARVLAGAAAALLAVLSLPALAARLDAAGTPAGLAALAGSPAAAETEPGCGPLGSAGSPPAPAPRVTVETLMPGTRYETRLYVIDSGRPGPTVWISGGIHGSEVAGWRAAEQVARWSVDRGRLVVLPRANEPAIREGRRYARGDTDLNRAFPIRGQRSQPTTPLARAIWDAVRRHRPQVLIDLHEALGNHNTDPSSVGQTLIIVPRPSMRSLAERAIDRLNREERVPSRWRFGILRYPVQGSLARAAGDILGIDAAIFETSRQLPLETRIRYQLKLVEIVLQEVGLQPARQAAARPAGVAVAAPARPVAEAWPAAVPARRGRLLPVPSRAA